MLHYPKTYLSEGPPIMPGINRRQKFFTVSFNGYQLLYSLLFYRTQVFNQVDCVYTAQNTPATQVNSPFHVASEGSGRYFLVFYSEVRK